jgi:hypothetical protein
MKTLQFFGGFEMRKLGKVLVVALLVIIAIAQVSQAKVVIHKIENSTVTVWNTFFGFRVGDPIYQGGLVGCTHLTVKSSWWATDLSVEQSIPVYGHMTSHSLGPVREQSPGSYVMDPLNAWLQTNYGFVTQIVPEVAHPQVDVHVAIDICEWLGSGLAPPPYGVPLDVNDIDGTCEDLPGYMIGTTPISFDPCQGWVNPDPWPFGDVISVGEIELTAPGADLDFTYTHMGVITQTDPDWVGTMDPEYPYQHIYELEFLPPPAEGYDVDIISDIHIEEPWVIKPGYIQIVPPAGWHDDGITIGRAGYEANPGAEITVGGGSLGIDFRVNGKVPGIVPGQVILTYRDVPVSVPKPTMVPDEPNEFTFTYDYLGSVYVGGDYPYEHSWELNITKWDPTVMYINDLHVEAPHIIPGYVEIDPPQDWIAGPWFMGRYGYEANQGNEIVNEGQYTDWKVRAKTPQVELGEVYLTQDGQQVSFKVETMVVSKKKKTSPSFMLDTADEWEPGGEYGEFEIMPLDPGQWAIDWDRWQQYHQEETEPYPPTEFLSPDGLYVYEPESPDDPCDAGLVMSWGETASLPQLPQGEEHSYASSWQLRYPDDPDLTNCIITVSVTAPQFDPTTVPPTAITQVSLGLQNNPMPGGATREWYWNCGSAASGAPITWNVPTTITIDTSITGVSAATPTATSYMNTPGFDLKTVQWVKVDENATWVGGATPMPGPGNAAFMWNYWHYLMVTPKTTVIKKTYTKWSQPPVVVDPNSDPPVIIGWDEQSDYHNPPIVADDWLCEDNRPVTDIHWWGSYIGWTQPSPPPTVPKAFHIGIWTDDPCDFSGDFSHPNDLIWENYCDNWVWNFAGYDWDPHNHPGDPTGANAPNEPGYDEPMDSCFQFNQLLSEDEWFYQEPNDANTVYWLSIAPIYQASDYPPLYPWGWKTRRPEWNDDAVRIDFTVSGIWPPVIGSKWGGGSPVKFPDTPQEWYSWDVAFELTTNEPGPPSADINDDGIVSFDDFVFLAGQWLTAGP